LPALLQKDDPQTTEKADLHKLTDNTVKLDVKEKSEKTEKELDDKVEVKHVEFSSVDRVNTEENLLNRGKPSQHPQGLSNVSNHSKSGVTNP